MPESETLRSKLRGRRRKHRRGIFGGSLTPLLDVLFLLLIFLLLAANYDKREVTPVSLPQASGEPLEKREVEEIVIVLFKDDSMLIDDQVIPVADLGATLKARPPEDRLRPVIIQGDQQASLGIGLQLFSELRDNGYLDCVFEVNAKHSSEAVEPASDARPDTSNGEK
jgi:biopolymer transport protein ExbD